MALVLDGVAFGLQLALLATGLTLIYGLAGVLNLAHGQLVVAAAMVGAVALGAGAPVLLALGLAVVTAGAAAVLLDVTLLRPVYRLRGQARVLLSLLLTLGVAFAADGLLVHSFPFTRLNLSVATPSVELLGVTVRSASVVASLVAIVALGGLVVLLRTTRVGRAIRSLTQDEEGAQLCGVDPGRTRRLVFVLGGSMAGLVAVTQGLVSSVGATSGLDLTIFALIVTVVGGLGRVSGAVVAGVLLGVVHAVAAFHIGTVLTFVILLVAAIVVILVRPSGILGGAGS
jgi:branched-chain amino acid transport system permease protein